MAAAISHYGDIPGWFYWFDKLMFDGILAAQDEPGNRVAGDLVEIGAYLGRSAVVIAEYQRPDVKFVVVDLFGDEEKLGDDQANRAENQGSYKSLTRQQFEANFLALRPTLPTVVQGLSTEVVEHVEPGAARFIHVDASHLYDPVSQDVVNSQRLLKPDGVVVFDDIRSEHTPGVAAAVWEAVGNAGLHPFAVTQCKLYATWGDPTRWLEVARTTVGAESRLRSLEHLIKGDRVLQISEPKPKPAPPPPVLSAADVKKIAEQVADIVDAKQQARAKARARARAKAAREREAASPVAAFTAKAKRYAKRRLS